MAHRRRKVRRTMCNVVVDRSMTVLRWYVVMRSVGWRVNMGAGQMPRIAGWARSCEAWKKITWMVAVIKARSARNCHRVDYVLTHLTTRRARK
jgi:hypothetical protein